MKIKALAINSKLARGAAGASLRAALVGVAVLSAGAGSLLAQKPAPPTVAAPGTAPITPRASAPLTAYTGPRYDNRWEVYGGLLYMNGQAGQDLPRKYSMGGGEVMGTYWLGAAPVKKWGVAADIRLGAGTSQTGLIGASYGLNRILVMQDIFSAGGVYRTSLRNRYLAVDLHALAGGTYGVFDHALVNYPGYPATPPIVACPSQITATKPLSLGMYCNHVSPWGAAGGSLDFNQSGRLAIRLQPDMTFEHFGTETREFFAVSLGAMYRFGGTK